MRRDTPVSENVIPGQRDKDALQVRSSCAATDAAKLATGPGSNGQATAATRASLSLSTSSARRSSPTPKVTSEYSSELSFRSALKRADDANGTSFARSGDGTPWQRSVERNGSNLHMHGGGGPAGGALTAADATVPELQPARRSGRGHAQTAAIFKEEVQLCALAVPAPAPTACCTCRTATHARTT